MPNRLIYSLGSTEACRYASSLLESHGYQFTDHPTPEITHLLLDVPSFQKNGRLRNGSDISRLLLMLPQGITVIGGNLDHPALVEYAKLDLLQNEEYLAQNAAITAHCALRTAGPLLKTTLPDTPTLVIGWGRIGKCLAHLLKGVGCNITVAARKAADRAMLSALGYPCISIAEIPSQLSRFRLLFNTVPVPLFTEEELPAVKNCVIIELASITALEHRNIVIARGLPGTLAPKSSGTLIAGTILRLWKEEKI